MVSKPRTETNVHLLSPNAVKSAISLHGKPGAVRHFSEVHESWLADAFSRMFIPYPYVQKMLKRLWWRAVFYRLCVVIVYRNINETIDKKVHHSRICPIAFVSIKTISKHSTKTIKNKNILFLYTTILQKGVPFLLADQSLLYITPWCRKGFWARFWRGTQWKAPHLELLWCFVLIERICGGIYLFKRMNFAYVDSRHTAVYSHYKSALLVFGCHLRCL